MGLILGDARMCALLEMRPVETGSYARTAANPGTAAKPALWA